MSVRLQRESFDTGAEIAALSAVHEDVGAVVSFTGLCRAGPPDRRISALTLEHYPAMAQRELERLEAEARARWPLTGCIIIHRYGRLTPGEPIVLVVTVSEHRQAAFEAAQFLMDYLKTDAPFWKKEERDGESRWVEERASDAAAAKRWK